MIENVSLPRMPWVRVNGSPAVLTVRQPWAWALVSGHKDVENRTWPTSSRGLVAIHAAQRSEPEGYGVLRRMGLEVPEDLPRGTVVGAVEVIDVVRNHPSPWASPDGFNWVIGHAFPVDPLPMRGHLGLFGAPPSVAEALIDAFGDPVADPVADTADDGGGL